MLGTRPFRGASLAAVVAALCAALAAPAQQRSEASPAARPVPRTATPQDYAPELVATGRARFAASCAFCHGPEATGGSGGPDLTRSEVVAADARGTDIGPLVRAGRPDAGMPAFPSLPESDVAAIVAFVHDQKAKAEAETGGRRSVEVADLQTGNARVGKRYFEAACVRCHSASGDFAHLASRLQGLPLLRRMLYPGGQPGAREHRPIATVTTHEGESVTGEVGYRDEFTIAVIDADGRYRSWQNARVSVTISDPLEAHVEQLGRYTDASMHDVFAYLQTLR
jgi:cytochrome c oxidase cbb3-type subunit 3